jgi:hypothetical protein
LPDHKELDRGILRAILRGAGVAVDEFIELQTNARTGTTAGDELVGSTLHALPV